MFEQTLTTARLQRGVALVGICNVTPNSFSDGGKFIKPDDARARVDALVEEGADLVDIGGESTRPGAEAVPAQEQLARILDVVAYAARKVPVSVDTTDPDVADACLGVGAVAINDVSCLRSDALARVARAHDAILMMTHTRGTPDEMKTFGDCPEDAYDDMVEDVIAEWKVAEARALDAGLQRSALVMDPGFGFAKNAHQSAELLRRLSEVVDGVGVPVLVAASRKSFLARLDPQTAPLERLGASVAAAVWGMRAGASLVRVHDVRATRQAIDWDRWLSGGGDRA